MVDDKPKPASPISKVPKKSAAPRAPPIGNGSTMKLGRGSDSAVDGHVFTSKVWTSNRVGSFIDIPFAGTPAMRALVGQFAVHSVEKVKNKRYGYGMFGESCVLMNKKGIDHISHSLNIDSDGAPNLLRITIITKPHAVGQVVGAMLAYLQFDPSVAELNSPFMVGFPRDKALLKGVASQFSKAVSGHVHIAFISGKPIPAVIPAKFSSNYTKNKQALSFTGSTNTIPGDVAEKVVNTALYQSPLKALSTSIALAIASLPISGKGVPSVSGQIIAMRGDEETSVISSKQVKAVLVNEPQLNRIIKQLEGIANRDKHSGNSFPTVVAIAGIRAGLPIQVGVAASAEKAGSSDSIIKMIRVAAGHVATSK